MTKTLKQTVYEMLTEDTGHALMDSGDAYGRNFERNQKKTLADFEEEPTVSFDQPTEKTDYLEWRISTFRYLTEYARLELDDLCDTFNSRFVPTKDWSSDRAYGLSEKGEKWLLKKGFTFKETWNSYNGECDLDQTLQGTFLELGLNGEKYVLLQIHGGCDVRGGYTDARLFKLQEEYLDLTPSIYGTINGVEVETHGEATLSKADGKPYERELEPTDKIELSLC